MKPLVVFTFALFTLLVLVSYQLNSKPLQDDPVEINIEGQPTIGYAQAKVHLVLIEEPKCVNCHRFNMTILPSIKKEFIDTQKVTLTIIPVCFLQGSMPAAMALLCAYHENPEFPNDQLFFDYLDSIARKEPNEYENWATPAHLLEIAKETPAIDPLKLQSCIDEQTYRIQIEKNTKYCSELMKGPLATPSLYVNGIKVNKLDYANVKECINEQLMKQGVQ